MPEIKLARLPDRTPIKLAIIVTPELHKALADYATLYNRTYAQSEPITELIPHMIAAFLASDRAFAKTRETLGGTGT